MPNSGTELGADLYELWRAGTDNLPSVAAVYRAASGHVAGTDSGLPYAFMRPDRFGGGTYGPVYAPWRGLRDELEKILSDTATSLELTGEALRLAAAEYARTDSAAADELNRLRGTSGEPGR
jgi:hypothetical protein